jgi:hypothetical protein
MTAETQRTGSQSEAPQPPLAAAAGCKASPALSLIPCPACGLAGEITERFTLASSLGPVEHIALVCIAGHVFRMAVDRLQADAQVLVRAGHAGGW